MSEVAEVPDSGTGRIEAFSDGVFAIAITLLVLELKEPESGDLWQGLLHEWPQFAAYLVSFFIIGIMWMNHHSMFRLIVRSDRWLLLLNLLLLLFVSLLPFPTMLVARNLGAGGHDARVAEAVYSTVLTLAAITFSLLWWHAVRADLLATKMPREQQLRSVARFSVGTFVYGATIAVAFISPVAALALQFVLAAYYLFEQVTAKT